MSRIDPKTAATPHKLDGIGLLQELDPKAIAELEQSATWRLCRAEETIFDRNSQSRDVFFVVAGQVSIKNFSSTGREVAHATVGPGAFFGELAAIDGEQRSATAVAHSDCLLAALSPERFRDLIKTYPSVALHVMERLAQIIRSSTERIMDLATLGAVQRVHQEILRLAQPDTIVRGAWRIYPVPTQHAIATRAVTTRETVARVLSQLQQSGMIDRKGRSLVIADRAKLELLTERIGSH